MRLHGGVVYSAFGYIIMCLSLPTGAHRCSGRAPSASSPPRSRSRTRRHCRRSILCSSGARHRACAAALHLHGGGVRQEIPALRLLYLCARVPLRPCLPWHPGIIVPDPPAGNRQQQQQRQPSCPGCKRTRAQKCSCYRMWCPCTLACAGFCAHHWHAAQVCRGPGTHPLLCR